MQTVAHAMPPPGRAPRRLTGFLLAILLQVAFIAALMWGLDIKVWPKPDDGIITKFIPTRTNTVLPPPPANPIWVEPSRVPLPDPPVWDRGEERPGEITPPPGTAGGRAGPADHGPISVGPTHTTPPYPPLAARLGQEGTVYLRLVVSAQGAVTDAVVVRSSGYVLLDDAARAWVVAHWRYQPAVRGGAPAAGVMNVAVTFNLRNAG